MLMNDNLSKDLKLLIYALLAVIIMVEITFITGNILTNIKLAFTYFLMLFLPGYFIGAFIIPKSGFVEKLIVGAVIMVGALSTLAYFSGILLGDYRYSFITDAMILAVFVWLRIKTEKNVSAAASEEDNSPSKIEE